MTKKFENRIRREGIVDTKNYRYRYVELIDRAEIKRLPIPALDTTEALDGWETIKIYQ